jgi:hypothetical protein
MANKNYSQLDNTVTSETDFNQQTTDLAVFWKSSLPNMVKMTFANWKAMIRAFTITAGGTDGQVLTKQSGTDYDVAWETMAGGGGGGGAPRTVNPKWELNLTSETYLIDGEGAFSIAISSDSEVGTLSFKRRIKGNVFDDNLGSYFTLSEINAWLALRSGDEWEIGCFPNTPDFDPDNDTINELVAVGCILEFTQL